MYSNHLAATGAATLAIGFLPLWIVGAAFVLVGAGLLATRAYKKRHGDRR